MTQYDILRIIKDKNCWVSVSYLKKKLKITRNSIIENIRKLKKAGFIDTDKFIQSKNVELIIRIKKKKRNI